MITNQIIADINDYEPIPQSEYKRLKRDDPKHYHDYTARIKHNYFKRKKEFRFEKNNFVIDIIDSGMGILDNSYNSIFIGKPDGERFNLLKQAIQKCEEVFK